MSMLVRKVKPNYSKQDLLKKLSDNDSLDIIIPCVNEHVCTTRPQFLELQFSHLIVDGGASWDAHAWLCRVDHSS